MSTHVHVFDRFLEIAVLLQEDLASGLAAFGLTTARAHLLWELHRLGPSTQQALAAGLKVSPRNVTGLVDAVEEAGFVERRPHPTDRRALLVTLTDLGTQTMSTMAREREQAAQQLVADLDAAQLEQFRQSLDFVADRLRSLVAAAGPGRRSTA